MEKMNAKLKNRSTLIAAAIMVTAATGFGTYAATSEDNLIKSTEQKDVLFFNQELTAEQKAGLEEARELFKAGDEEGAKAALDKLDLDDIEFGFHIGGPAREFMKDLTEEQQEAMKDVKELFKAGKEDEAKALLEKFGIELPHKFAMKLEMNEADEAKLKEARELMKAGNQTEALAKLDGLDLQLTMEGPFMDNLTEDQKLELEKAQKLMLLGARDEAKKIMEALGVPVPPAFGHMGPPPFMSEEAIKALEAGDYEAWKTAISNEKPEAKILEEIDEAKFKILVEAHKAMLADDFERAKNLIKEAGIKMPFFKREFHMMKDNLTEEQKAQLDEAHQLMESGNEEGAKAIFEELGMPFPEKFLIKMNLSEEDKAKLEQAKSLMDEGKTEEAEAIFDELGLTPPVKGFRLNKMNVSEEEGDFKLWLRENLKDEEEVEAETVEIK